MTRRLVLALLFSSAFLVACGGDDTGGGTDPGGPSTPPEGGGADPGGASTPAVGAVAAADAFIGEQTIDKAARNWKLRLPKPPEFEFDPAHDYFWVLDTNKGRMKFQLFTDVAPMHVSSTIYLTRLGYFDGISFHRVLQDFMAQGGCPLGTGTGSPGYRFDGEFRHDVVHDRPGLLSAANSGPGTDGSQFFITFKATPWLDGNHTIYGEIVEGADVVNVFNSLAAPQGSSSQAPREPLVIEKATIEVDG
ncbi:MAG: peptidylprolyl isomerase [Planctomycetota bacterium]